MPSFEFLDQLELFMRSGAIAPDATKSIKKSIKAASKRFRYKDGRLWRPYRGRLLRVVRSDQEVKELMVRYHDDNNHAGRVRVVREIMLMYYWVGVTEVVKSWISDCVVCQTKTRCEARDRPTQFCLAYGCDASSLAQPTLGFHRFPKDLERRRRWLAAAQRDEGSLRMNSYLCSRHFLPSCLLVGEDGHMTLSPDAEPTVTPEALQGEGDEVPVPSDDDLLRSSSLEDLLPSPSPSYPTFDPCAPPGQLQEHRYSRTATDPDATPLVATARERKRRQHTIEPGFTAYNLVARFLMHKLLPWHNKRRRESVKRMAKRFALIDGVLMYTRVQPPVVVPRSREEVNSILRRFHDDQGHRRQGVCQQEISRRYYWASMTRDVTRWTSSCSTCLSRSKRRWLRCSVHTCTNCCGPVERRLGLTFHTFPLHNPALLSQWLKAVGRPRWHPRLRSSVCSAHFTLDCYDRSGDDATLRPDAVPTLLVQSDSATWSSGPVQPEAEEAYFAKYDAAELYLSKRTYPPGLSYVEKNTFRRFCRKFTIKDQQLHLVCGDQVRLVLRSRQQVEASLTDYHNELNHLDQNKCLRLLNQRFFWKTMRADVARWISSCPQCWSRRSRRSRSRGGPGPQTEPGGALTLQTRSPQIHEEISSVTDGDSPSEDDEGDEGDEDVQVVEEAVSQQEVVIEEPVVDPPLPPETPTPIMPQPKIPILLHLRTNLNLQPSTPIILQPGSTHLPLVARLWSPGQPAPPPPEETRTCSQETEKPQEETLEQTSVPEGSARTHHYAKPAPEAAGEKQQQQQQQEPPGESRGQRSQRPRGSTDIRRPPKRRVKDGGLEGGPAARKKTSTSGLEPVLTPSGPPTTGSAPSQTDTPPPETDSVVPPRRPRRLQARTVVQMCSSARVRTRAAVEGGEAQWAEITEGLVVYVCFFEGATEEVTQEMASSLMSTRLFRRPSQLVVSVLDLPGSVLLVPQESLVGEPVQRRRVRYRGGCEPWWGAQLFSALVSGCRALMAESSSCSGAGVKVEHGVYGQKQELVLSSGEPLTLLLEF